MEELYLALGVVALVGIAAFAAFRGVSIPVVGIVVFSVIALWTGQFFLTDATLMMNPALESVFWALVVTIPVTIVGISLGRVDPTDCRFDGGHYTLAPLGGEKPRRTNQYSRRPPTYLVVATLPAEVLIWVGGQTSLNHSLSTG